MSDKKKLELYIHIPFCERKCAYCDFLSMPATLGVQRGYVETLIDEIIKESAGVRDYEVSSIFIGGGTPSILPGEYILGILQAVGDYFDVGTDAEITIEINPGTLDPHKLECYREGGVNRVSLGLQSADDWELRVLGRIHTYDDFLKSYQQVRQAGFSNVNVDLMSALPGQTLDSWERTLKKVLMLRPEHISAYSLIIEEGTPFWDRYGAGCEKMAEKSAHQPGTCPGEAPDRFGLRRRDYPELPDEEEENRIYHLTRTFLAEQGYERYEISNYARPGFACRHNVGYWTEVEYLGLGLGASSFLGGCRFCNERDLERYLGLDFAAEDWAERLRPQFTRLSREARMEEFMFLGLRMIRGISEIDFVATFGVKLDSVYGPVIERLVKNGLLRREGVWLSLTEWGMDVSNFVLGEFLLTSA